MTLLIAAYVFIAWLVLVQASQTEPLPLAIVEAVLWPLVLVMAYVAAGVDAMRARAGS